MNIDKNSRVSTRRVIPPGGESSGKSKNLNVNLDQGWSKKTKVKLWIDDNANNDSVGISVNLNKRHNTCPNINQTSQYANTLAGSTTGRNMSLPTGSSNSRKSFLGELKSLLTFNKKQDGLPGESTTSILQQEDFTTKGRIVIEKEFDKENKKVALQNRRKQVFQKQDDDGEGSSTEEPTLGLAAVGTTVCLFYSSFLRKFDTLFYFYKNPFYKNYSQSLKSFV